jgi:hypothetical protein
LKSFTLSKGTIINIHNVTSTCILISRLDHALSFIRLFILRNAQYTNNTVCIVKYEYFYMFLCVYIIFRESPLIYAKVQLRNKISKIS